MATASTATTRRDLAAAAAWAIQSGVCPGAGSSRAATEEKMEPFVSSVLVFPPPKHAAAASSLAVWWCFLTCPGTRGEHPAALIGPRRGPGPCGSERGGWVGPTLQWPSRLSGPGDSALAVGVASVPLVTSGQLVECCCWAGPDRQARELFTALPLVVYLFSFFLGPDVGLKFKLQNSSNHFDLTVY
jgi:hypothetical protein